MSTNNSTFINLGNYSSPLTASKQIGASEAIQNVANRILHSEGYKRWYLGMAACSILVLILSLWEKCPRYQRILINSNLFYTLEVIINVGMVAEVAIRIIALERQFWRSSWNIADVLLTLFCIFSLIYLFTGTCSPERTREAEFDSFLLVIRNGSQFSRLASVIRKNNSQLSTRAMDLNFENIESDVGESNLTLRSRSQEVFAQDDFD
jgi:hypothetical protein